MSRIINVVVDDILNQTVQVIVSEWYYGRPSLWPFYASPGAREVRIEAGREVFRELNEEEPLDQGEAALTGAGRLRQYKGIVHVASRGLFGASSPAIIQGCARSAMHIVNSLGFVSVAFPVLGAGRKLYERQAYEILRDALLTIPTNADVRIVRAPDRHD